jgi:hypothetical protein
MADPKLILDHVFDHEAAQPDRIFLTQPVGGGVVRETTWQQTVDDGAWRHICPAWASHPARASRS